MNAPTKGRMAMQASTALLPEDSLSYFATQHHVSMLPHPHSYRDRRSYQDVISSPPHHNSMRSRSIPIDASTKMKRSPSEARLREDEELADFRDYVMFSRIVMRMASQQQMLSDSKLRLENDRCLAHVIGTRNGSEDKHFDRVSSDVFQVENIYEAEPTFHTSFTPQQISTRSNLRNILDMSLAANSAVLQQEDDDEIFALDL